MTAIDYRNACQRCRQTAGHHHVLCPLARGRRPTATGDVPLAGIRGKSLLTSGTPAARSLTRELRPHRVVRRRGPTDEQIEEQLVLSVLRKMTADMQEQRRHLKSMLDTLDTLDEGE